MYEKMSGKGESATEAHQGLGLKLRLALGFDFSFTRYLVLVLPRLRYSALLCQLCLLVLLCPQLLLRNRHARRRLFQLWPVGNPDCYRGLAVGDRFRKVVCAQVALGTIREQSCFALQEVFRRFRLYTCSGVCASVCA